MVVTEHSHLQSNNTNTNTTTISSPKPQWHHQHSIPHHHHPVIPPQISGAETVRQEAETYKNLKTRRKLRVATEGMAMGKSICILEVAVFSSALPRAEKITHCHVVFRKICSYEILKLIVALHVLIPTILISALLFRFSS